MAHQKNVVDPRITAKGTGTLARARWLKAQEEKEKLVKAQEEKEKQLVKARAPQADKAREYVFYGKGRPCLKADSEERTPAHVVFDATREKFLTTPKVAGQSTIVAATKAAADELAHLFDNKETRDEALLGITWAEKALAWAGNQIYKAAKE